MKNTSSGKVQGEAQGDEESIQKLVKDLERGPTHARVVKFEKNEIDVVDGDSGFSVKATS